MELIIKTGIFVLNIVFYIMKKLLPVQKKVVYISRQMNEIPLDFNLIKNEMENMYPEYKNVILAKRIPSGVVGKIGYLFHMALQMYHIATAQIVILDTYCILISILKQREELTVIQIWHAIGAFKKFGYSILDKEEGSSSKIANLMKMHHNYTYVFTSSEYAKPFFAEAFNQPLNKMKIYPLPRVDKLLDECNVEKIKDEIYHCYPRLRDTEKKIIVYAPTFRKNAGDFDDGIEKLISSIDFDKYEFIIKPHPLTEIKHKEDRAIFDFKFESAEMFYIADYVITDYSAIAFEAMLLEKPLLLYAFDYDSYHNKRDFYLNYQQFFGSMICKDPEELMQKIENNEFDLQKSRELIEIMVKKPSISYTKDICNFLGKLLLEKK